MSIRTAFKDGRIVGGVLMVGVVAALSVGGYTAVTAAQSERPAAVVETVEPVDLTTIPYTNGLAAEQETEAAAAEAARIAAEAAAAEAARVAAEQAAAAEAERIAAEQAAAEEEPAPEEPVDDGIPDGAWPLPWIPSPDPVNAPDGGRWDMSNCFGHGETINGQPYCIP